jgi:hypothetical protein
LRLDARLRLALYALFAVLFATGGAWLLADALKASSAGESWQTLAANLLMVHGGAAMVVLFLFGVLTPLHVQRAWRSGRNRTTGLTMVAFNGVLVVTSFGLYYAGSETMRPWLSNIHIGVGLCLPALLLVHIAVGRRSSSNLSSGASRSRGPSFSRRDG